MTDPFKSILKNTYEEYSKSSLKSYDWYDKIIWCPVCNCSMKFQSLKNHIYTDKHRLNLIIFKSSNSRSPLI